MVTRSAWLAVALGAWFAVSACAYEPCDGRDDMLDSADGILLTIGEHEAGWGKDVCTQCHALETTHRVNCTSEPSIDMEAIREEAEEGTFEVCSGCHGSNGVEL